MRLENNQLILEKEECVFCSMNRLPKGKTASRKACPTCKGKGRGPRGGKGGCQECMGNRKVPDWDTPVDCKCCDGTGEVPETMTSYINEECKKEVIDSLPIKLFFAERGMSFNESYLGIGTIFSCSDYGRTWDKLESRSQESIRNFLEQIRKEILESGLQACKIADDDGILINHIVVIVNQGGYSVRPSKTNDSSDIVRKVNKEPLEAAATIHGAVSATRTM